MLNLQIEPPNLYDLNKKAELQKQEKQMLEKRILDVDILFQDMDICDSQPMSPNNMDSSQIFDFDFNFNNNESSNFQESISYENLNKFANIKNEDAKQTPQKYQNFPVQLPEIEESSLLKSNEIQSNYLEVNNKKNQQNTYLEQIKISKCLNKPQSPSNTVIYNSMINNYSKNNTLDNAFILNSNNNLAKNTTYKSNSNQSQSTRNGESLKDNNILKQLNNSDYNHKHDFFNDIFFSQSLSKNPSSKQNSFSCDDDDDNFNQFNQKNLTQDINNIDGKINERMSLSQKIPHKYN